jgi:hypothetical protein
MAQIDCGLWPPIFVLAPTVVDEGIFANSHGSGKSGCGGGIVSKRNRVRICHCLLKYMSRGRLALDSLKIEKMFKN